jgi:hypothetical protein
MIRSRILSVMLLLAAVGLLPPPPAAAQRDERHRVPAEAMSFRAAQWLERDERIEQERPEEVLDSLGLAAGDIVADVGPGGSRGGSCRAGRCTATTSSRRCSTS